MVKLPAAARRDESALDTGIYCVSNNKHFLGFVALLNSLRLVGHDEPVFLVDAGLTSEQRSLLSDHATLIPADEGTHAVLLAPLGPRRYPARVAILLDADIIVVRPLTELITAARGGQLVVFVNNEPNHDRFFPEWGPALGLGPLRRYPYVTAGHLLVPNSLADMLLQSWTDGQTKIDLEDTRYGGAQLPDPFYFADMDVLNAVIAASLEPNQMRAIENRLAPNPPFAGLRLFDKKALTCGYADGTQPFLLHHFLAKPWLSATRTSIYSTLMTRLLLAPDVALRLPPEYLPRRLREGKLAAADRARANVQAMVYWNARRQLGRLGIRTRLRARHRRNIAARP